MGKSSVVTLMQLVLLLLVAFFVAVSVVVCQWCFEFLGDKMLGIYNRSSHLSYLWHSSIDPVDDCRNCEELMINILYPLESDGILARGAEMKWEIRSSYLKDFSSSNKFSQLKEVVFKENNTSGLTLQPCMQISSYLDHANQFWQSNKQNIYFLLPQKDSVVSMRMPATENFDLLDHAASYTLEVSARLGLCHISQSLRKSAEEPQISEKFFEPSSRDQCIEIRRRRSFYSLQFRAPSFGVNGSVIETKRKEDNFIVVKSNIDTFVNHANFAENEVDSTSQPVDVSTLSNNIHSETPSSAQKDLFATSTVQLTGASVSANNEAFILAAASPAAIAKLLLSRKDSSDPTAKRIDILQQAGLRASITQLDTTISNRVLLYPQIQLPHNIPKLHQKQKMYISYPESLSTLELGGSCDLSLSFPLTFLQVPGIQFAALIDGTSLYKLNLSWELASVLQRIPTAAEQMKQRWIDATHDFIQFAAKYEVSELARRYPQLATQQVMLSVEDFLPAFLESQIYQQQLFSGMRHLSIVTLPELLEGWHHVEVFATVPTKYLRHKLMSSINHREDLLKHEMDSDASSIVAFDCVRFQVVSSKSSVDP